MGKTPRMSERGKKCLVIGAFVLFVLFMIALFYFVGRPLLRFLAEPQAFRDWVDSHGLWGRVLFVGMVVFQVIVAIVPGEPFEIGAGYAFGAVEGTLLSLAGIFIGSVCVFLFVRFFGVRAVEIFFSRDKLLSLRFLQNSRKLNTTVFIIFLIPGTPKDLLSYFVGLTDMKLSAWMLISTIARLPSLLTSVIGGNALGEQDYIAAGITFAIALAVSVIGLWIYNVICKRHQEEIS